MKLADNPPIQICTNKIKNCAVFKIKTDFRVLRLRNNEIARKPRTNCC